MRYPKGCEVRCRISFVEALEERDSTLRDVGISVGSLSFAVPARMKIGDYAEYWGDGVIRVFDRNGIQLSTSPVEPGPQLSTGENKLTLKAAGSGNVTLTVITLGK
jgi:dissimilatory sulfite reductase (desulfoviridin) alpha/beta subunit